MPLLMLSRIRVLPASGATVIVRCPLAARALVICSSKVSARKDATEKLTPWRTSSAVSSLICG